MKPSHSLVFFPLGSQAGNIKLKRGPCHLSVLDTTLLPLKNFSHLWLLEFPSTVQCHHMSQRKPYLCFGSRVMKAFGSKGVTASRESYKEGNQPSPKLQAREEVKCYTHLALAATRRAGGRTRASRCAPQSQLQ